MATVPESRSPEMTEEVSSTVFLIVYLSTVVTVFEEPSAFLMVTVVDLSFVISWMCLRVYMNWVRCYAFINLPKIL